MSETIESQIYSALKTKLQELVSSGVLAKVFEGFEENLSDVYPAVYIDVVSHGFEAITPNKDEFRMEVDLEVECFNEEYSLGKEEARKVVMQIRDHLVADRTLSNTADVLHVESHDFEAEAYPDGYLFHGTISVEIVRWMV